MTEAIFLSFVHVPSMNVEEAGFMTYTAASQQDILASL